MKREQKEEEEDESENEVNESELFGLGLSGFLPGTVDGRRMAATCSAVTSISPPARPLRDRDSGNVAPRGPPAGLLSADSQSPATALRAAFSGSYSCIRPYHRSQLCRTTAVSQRTPSASSRQCHSLSSPCGAS